MGAHNKCGPCRIRQFRNRVRTAGLHAAPLSPRGASTIMDLPKLFPILFSIIIISLKNVVGAPLNLLSVGAHYISRTDDRASRLTTITILKDNRELTVAGNSLSCEVRSGLNKDPFLITVRLQSLRNDNVKGRSIIEQMCNCAPISLVPIVIHPIIRE